MHHKLRHSWTLAVLTVRKYNAVGVTRMGAALAFYSIFSMSPLLLVATAVGAMVFGEKMARAGTIDKLHEVLGDKGADAVQALIASSSRTSHGVAATLVGLMIALWAASRVFIELREALNDIWCVDRRHLQFWKLALHDRAASFGMILLTGLALLSSIVVTTILETIKKRWGDASPIVGVALAQFYPMTSFAIIFGLFALIYKVLPACRVSWSDVWLGGILSAGLFSAGKYLIGLYLARTSTVSVYGAAGSLVILLIWAYYSSQIFLLGAVFSAVYSERLGTGRRTVNAKKAFRDSQRFKALHSHDDSTPP